MSEVNLEGLTAADCLELDFSTFYTQKSFMGDVAKLRDLVKKSGRERLTEQDQAEVVELRKRLKRANADSAMLVVIETRHGGGLQFF